MLLKLINKLINIDNNTKMFIDHNKKVFSKKIFKYKDTDPQILVEFNGWETFHLGSSYLLNALVDDFKANIIAYENFRILNPKKNLFWENIKWKIGIFFNIRTFRIYKSFGVNKFLLPKINYYYKNKAKKKIKKILSKIKSKKNVEDICVDNIWLGDLIYDTYLKKYNKPTIDINCPKFKDLLFEILSVFYYWKDYFKTHHVKAVAVSHGVYTFAIPLRIAVELNIPGYVSSESFLYKYDKRHISYRKGCSGMFMEGKFYKKIFSKLSKKTQIKSKKIGKQILNQHTHPLFNIIDKRKFTKINKNKNSNSLSRKARIIKKSNKIKVLILVQSLSDSPHAYGKNLFPDFYEWFRTLSQLISKTDYDWYIKPHPIYYESDMVEVKRFLHNNKNVSLIPARILNRQIVKEDLDFVLTVYGSAGREYPPHGITVINGSLHNPHIDFSFNLHPKNLKEYKNMIMNLDKINHKVNFEEIYIYNFMRFVYFDNNFLFDNFDKMIALMKDAKLVYTPDFYIKWIENWNIEKHQQVINSVKDFSKSKDYLLNFNHQKKKLIN